MPRIVVLADCVRELGDRPIVLDERIRARAFDEREDGLDALIRVLGSAVAQAEEVERRVSALYS